MARRGKPEVTCIICGELSCDCFSSDKPTRRKPVKAATAPAPATPPPVVTFAAPVNTKPVRHEPVESLIEVAAIQALLEGGIDVEELAGDRNASSDARPVQQRGTVERAKTRILTPREQARVWRARRGS